MSNQNGVSAAAKYRAQNKDREAVIVDVTVPSGFVFKFRKPGVFGTMFGVGTLPQAASSGAVDAWIKQGLIKPNELAADQQKQIDLAMRTIGRVIELSYEPKLVSGLAQNDNELSTDDVAEPDLAFLFQWIASGGTASSPLATFPARSGTNAVARTGRPKRRAKAK